MPVRVDWVQIKDAWPDETVVLFLNSRARHLLLSIIDSLRWSATYDKQPEAATDWDYIQRIVANAEYELGGAMPVSELIPYIDEIESLLREINAGRCACESGVFTQQPYGIAPNTGTTIEDGQGTPPTEYGDQPITTWGEWEDYKCEAAYLLTEQVALKLEDFSGLLDDYEPEEITTEMAGWVLSKLNPLLVFISLAWDVFQSILGIGWGTIGDFSTAADEIRANADTIACAIMNSDGARDCAEQFELACQDAVTGAAGDLLLGLFPWEQWANIIYTGKAVTQDGVEVQLTDVLDPPGTHTCCLPTPPAGASSYPVEILDVTIATDPGHESDYSLDSLTINGASFDLQVSKLTTHGDYLYVDITLAASPYFGYPGLSHRGLVYRGYTWNWGFTLNDISPISAGFLQGGQKVGQTSGTNWNEANLSYPYAEYGNDLAAYMGLSWTHTPTTTTPLNQDPDQERVLRLRTLFVGNSSQPITITMDNFTLHWALYLT